MNVTTLLVLTTIFISIFNALPRTSYIKAVDFWLITNLMIPFFDMILQSFINMLQTDDKYNIDYQLFRALNPDKNDMDDSATNNYRRGGERKKLLSLLRFLAGIVLPAFYILFCIAFFVYGMIIQ